MAKEKKISNTVLERLKKNTTLKYTALVSDSVLFSEMDMIQTPTPMINVALAGELAGGFVPGLTCLAGPSRHFKSGFAMVFVKAFQDKYPDGIVLFYDSEFGTPQNYFTNNGIDMGRVVHSPITDIEEFNHDIVTQLKELERGDKVLILVDSIGNLASRKEVDDALKGSDKADLTRPKRLKSLFRMITPHLKIKNIPMIAINHTYSTMELYSKQVMGGGTGPMFAADTVWILGRQQDADKEDGKKVLNGYKFVINVEKSRFVREKSKIIIEVNFEKGLSAYSGLLDAALEAGFVVEYKQGKSNVYAHMDPDTGEYDPDTGVHADDTENTEFWKPILTDERFHQAIRNKYKLERPKTDEELEAMTGEDVEVELEAV
jgi:RecA/RadA recombinase